jgi:hypothetical protein
MGTVTRQDLRGVAFRADSGGGRPHRLMGGRQTGWFIRRLRSQCVDPSEAPAKTGGEHGRA